MRELGPKSVMEAAFTPLKVKKQVSMFGSWGGWLHTRLHTMEGVGAGLQCVVHRLPAVLRWAALCVLGLSVLGLSPACVPSVPHFITQAEVATGHPAEAAEYGAVASWREAAVAPTNVAPNGMLRREGYWHWDGTRYVRVAPAWEATNPPYVWAWQQ